MESEWFQTLVIILAVMLALFLLLSIILLVRLVQIIKQVNRIVDHAEQTIDKAEHVASFFKATATPIAILKLISNVSESFQKAAKRGKK